MIVAAGRRGDADEDAVDEEGHRRLLQPQPGMADRAGDDVAHHQHAEAGDGDAAQDHQDVFERIERAPLQVALLLQDQAVIRRHLRIPNLRSKAGSGAGSRPAPRSAIEPPISRCGRVPRTFTACGPRSLASLSWIGLLICMKPLLSTFLTTLTPIFSSLASASCSSLKATVGSFLADLVGRGLHPFLLLVGEAAPHLVADEQRGVVGFVLGERQHRRGLVVLVDEVVVDAVLGHVDDAGLQRGVDLAERHVHDLRAVGRERRRLPSPSPARAS